MRLAQGQQTSSEGTQVGVFSVFDSVGHMISEAQLLCSAVVEKAAKRE